MKKTIFPIISKILKMISLCVILLTLFLNLSTLWAINHIKRGGYVKTGYFSAIIGSGSMAPALWIDDLLLIKGSPSYQADDIITYVSQQESLVTHRIREVSNDGYMVQGDANNVPDENISEQRVLGKVIFVLSGAGNVIDAFLSPAGMIFLLSFPVFLWLTQRIRREQNQENQNIANTPFDDKQKV